LEREAGRAAPGEAIFQLQRGLQPVLKVMGRAIVYDWDERGGGA
jgi:hypothetical protein